MKYFKYWVNETLPIRVAGQIENINLLSGSNISKADAAEAARKQSQVIEQRIAEGESKKDYEVPIKEYVTDVIDDANIISICRYGAKILNTTNYTILDLDDYPLDFLDMFRSLGKLSKKERIVHKFLERIKKLPDLGNDFRIYETTKGVRVIGKKYIDPSDKGYTALMRKLAVDWIYIQLSKKQNCYRARITPKPYRMKMRTIKIKSPLDCETQEYQSWTQDYARASQKFSVVKLMQTVGRDFSGDQVIRLHDDMCNERYRLTLA